MHFIDKHDDQHEAFEASLADRAMALFRLAYLDTQHWIDLGEAARDRRMAALHLADMLACQVRQPDVIVANGQQFGRYGMSRAGLINRLDRVRATAHQAYLEDRSMTHDLRLECWRYGWRTNDLLAGARLTLSSLDGQAFPIINQPRNPADPTRLVGAAFVRYDSLTSVLYVREAGEQGAQEPLGQIRTMKVLAPTPEGGSPYAFGELIAIEAAVHPELGAL